jgi:outer membrane protein assembly factor BamB
MSPRFPGLSALLVVLLLPTVPTIVSAADWPQWGNTLSRNMVSAETGLPNYFSVGVPGRGDTWVTKPENLKWAARLGTQTYGSPTIAGGKVFIGTNNGVPRNPRLTGDRHVLMCFAEADGKFLWQMATPRRERSANFNPYYGSLGTCVAAAVDEARAYVVTSRCHVVSMALDPLGAGGKPLYDNQAAYLAPPAYDSVVASATGPRVIFKPGSPVPLGPTDANLAWVFDLVAGAGSWPHEACSSSVLQVGDALYVGTGNGKGSDHRTTPSPQGASLIMLDKRTGKLLACDNAAIAPGVFHGQWSSPSYAVVNGRPLVFYGGGDGVCYAFDAHPEARPNGKPGVLRCVWRCDGNPPEARRRAYRDPAGPNDIIGTPVFCDGRVYVATGQDPRHGPGRGCLTCIDATRTGKLVDGAGVRWRYQGIGRSCSTVSVADGLVYAVDFAGLLHCVDAATGKLVWSQDLQSKVWGSTLCADGKVYVGTERGQLWVLKAGREKQVLSTLSMRSPIYTTPAAANGVLYVATHRYLYALAKPGVDETVASR